MEFKDYKRISSKSRIIDVLHGFVSSFFWCTIALVVSHFTKKWIGDLVKIAALIFSCWGIFVSPFLNYKRWKYRVLENRIDIKHGIFYKSYSVVPVCKIQYLKTVQGSFQRLFNLTSIEILTAGNSVEIPNIAKEDANEIIEYINANIQVGDEIIEDEI